MGVGVAGIVMAGGRSSRMGQNKALMLYRGRKLIDLAQEHLRMAGVWEIFISGAVEGYTCLPDTAPGFGPAQALVRLAEDFEAFESLLVIPVDMPLLTGDILKVLLHKKEGAFYAEHFLPAHIPLAKLKKPVTNPAGGKGLSIRSLLGQTGIKSIPLPAGEESFFLNVNTPEDFSRLTGMQ